MKLLGVFLALWVISGISTSFGADEKVAGFQAIPFGSTYQEVKDYLVREGLERLDSINLDEKYSSSGRRSLRVSNFSLGTLTVTVSFSFDHEGKFYAFTFYTYPQSAQYLGTTVMPNGKYLTDIFKKKYGKPSQCFSPSVLDIRTGYVAYLCRWRRKDLEIYTGVSESEFEYYVEGIVADKIMKKNYEKFKEDKEKAGVSTGADRF